jgi:aspartyl-tRNA(Asn)/glutamyl-tRNA(Gln) amidotransferase subunit A
MLAVKDLLCVSGLPVTCGSRMLESFTSVIESTAVTRLREAGAVVLGKTNCDEFGMGSSNENSFFGRAKHPTHPDRVPGGSSGGSAAAVAAGLCHAALGTDTGGSIRQPAAFCGIVGLKPTYGRVSRYGLVAYASSFDTVGPMTPDIDLSARMLEVMAGEDENDGTSSTRPVPAYRDGLTAGVSGLRVGRPREYFEGEIDPQSAQRVDEAVERLRNAGATIVDVSLPHTRYGIAAYYVLTTAEASSNLARYDGVRYGYRADEETVLQSLRSQRSELESALKKAASINDTPAAQAIQSELDALPTALDAVYTATRAEGFGDEVKRRIMLGTYVLSAGYYDAYYGRAQRARRVIRSDFDRVFEDVDLLITPADPGSAFEAGSRTDDPMAMYLSDVFTVGASLAGVPGLVVPAGRTDADLPIGVQLLAAPFREHLLLRAGHVLESTVD